MITEDLSVERRGSRHCGVGLGQIWLKFLIDMPMYALCAIERSYGKSSPPSRDAQPIGERYCREPN
jgi:hypothetical protein